MSNQHKPLAVDLFCGLGGWTEGFLSEGYDVIGFDIERHDYGTGGYPGQLVIQDVLTLHGSQFRNAACIVASPPCQFFSYCAMPWSRAQELAKRTRENEDLLEKELALFRACFRIQRQACEAAGHHIPMIVENVKGAQPFVGKAKWHFGSYFLWGDIPALMPQTKHTIDRRSELKGWINGSEGVKLHLSGRSWYTQGLGKVGSKSPARKAASAMIAKIPLPLAQHIAKAFRPHLPASSPVPVPRDVPKGAGQPAAPPADTPRPLPPTTP